MLLKLNNKYRQRGIGLLELMLSLAIIALLLIMATRYYSSTQRSKEIAEAVTLVHAIRAGAHNYSKPGGYSNVPDLMSVLISAGLLPKYITAGGTASPWGTPVTAKIENNVLTIEMETLATGTGEKETGVCAILEAQINNADTVGTKKPAKCEAKKLIVTY